MRTLRLRPRGFTIVEMLIAAMIAILIFGIGFAIMNGAMMARAHAAGRIQSTESARIFFDRLRADLDSAIPSPWGPALKKDDLNKAAPSLSQIGPSITMTTAKADYPQAQISTFATKHSIAITSDIAVSSVRYFVFKNDVADETGTLHREISFIQPPSSLHPFYYQLDPIADTQTALFPDVFRFEVTFMRWDEASKAIVDASLAPATATNLEVTMIFLDPNKSLDPKKIMTPRMRTFRELLALPEGLK